MCFFTNGGSVKFHTCLTADDAGERPVAVFLPGEVDEAGPDGGGLALPDLLQADGRRRVVVRRLVAHAPPHVHH